MLLRHLVIALLLAAASTASAQSALFESSSAKKADLTPRQSELLAAFQSEPGTGAVELVTANASLLGQASAVSVTLSSGLSIALETTTVTRRTAIDLSWSGRTAASGGEAALVSRNGWLTGTIWNDGVTYVVRPLTGGLHAIAVFDASGLQDHPDDYEELMGSQSGDMHRDLGHNAPSPDGSGARENKGGAVVDVLVVYTADLVANSADPVAFAQSAIDASNTSYANSGIATVLQMVHAYESPDASGGDGDLQRLSSSNDGFFDEAHGLREAYGADMVTLIGPPSSTYGYCGVAWLNAPSDGNSGPFSITARDCAVGNLSFAHELGHNFGAQHNAGNGAGAYAYGFGTIAEPAGGEDSWRSVMAYNDCVTGPCTRLPQWSNPDVTVRGTVSGDAATRDNARVMDERGPVVGAFRAPATPPNLAYSPGSFSLELAPGSTSSLTLTLENTAASGAADLQYSADVENYSANSPAPTGSVLCTNGQALSQTALNTASPVTATEDKMGQSWTAPCTGTLTAVSVGNFADIAPGSAWTATLRVFAGDGPGALGSDLTTEPVSHTNGSGVETVEVPLSSPIAVTEGQSYTWFMDMLSGTAGAVYNIPDVLAGGQRYRTTNGVIADAAGQGDDMNFSVSFRAPDRWASLGTASGSVAQGGSSTVTVNVDATGLTADTYTVDLVVQTNDPDSLSVTIPITLYVGAGTAIATIDGDAGWRLFSAAAPGMTVADLAGLNRLSGIPGYNLENNPGGDPEPNLFTGYDGTNVVAATGGAEALTSGEGFWWYLYDVNFSDGPTNQSYALPFTLATPLAPTTSDVDVTLHADGSKVNLLGNPFGQSLDLSGMNTWAGRSNLLTPVVAIYNSGTNTYSYSTTTPVVSAWQGFYAYGETAGTLTIPEAARTTGGTLVKQDDRMFLAFELTEQTDSGQPLADLGAVLYFDEAASAGKDLYDLAELTPVDARYVTLAFGAETASGEIQLRGHEGRSPADGAFEIPLHVATVGTASTMDLTWPSMDRLPEDWGAKLLDLETGATIDLRNQTNYTFEVESGEALSGGAAMRPSSDAGASALAADNVPARFVLTVTPSFATSTSPEASGVLSLSAPVPNPARGTAQVRYALPASGAVSLDVVDLLGRRVMSLVDGESVAGLQMATMDVSSLAAGVYAVRLQSGDEVRVVRMTVVR